MDTSKVGHNPLGYGRCGDVGISKQEPCLALGYPLRFAAADGPGRSESAQAWDQWVAMWRVWMLV